MNNQSAFVRGMRDGMPICLGYLSVSFTFGMRAVENGMPFWMALLISMTNLTSAGQFAGLDLMLAGAQYVEIAMTTLIINMRYLLMSLSLSQKVEPSMGVLKRALVAFGVTDEVFAVSMQQSGLVKASYMAGLILTPYLGWASGTLVGGVATSMMPASIRSAMGIAIYGMFIAIIIPPTAKMRSVAFTIGVSVALSMLLKYLPIFAGLSSGWRIILCTLAAATLAAVQFPIELAKADTPDVCAPEKEAAP